MRSYRAPTPTSYTYLQGISITPHSLPLAHLYWWMIRSTDSIQAGVPQGTTNRSAVYTYGFCPLMDGSFFRDETREMKSFKPLILSNIKQQCTIKSIKFNYLSSEIYYSNGVLFSWTNAHMNENWLFQRLIEINLRNVKIWCITSKSILHNNSNISWNNSR